jgi:hypothetical protein
MEQYFFNKEVLIDSVYFQGSKRLSAYPKHMVYDNQEVTFKEGVQRLVQKGSEVIRMFHMTDGQDQYELRFEPYNQAWKLQHVVRTI